MVLDSVRDDRGKACPIKVCVFLSAYNGEKFIEEQMNSILLQVGDFELTLYIRDDGSQDATRNILETYATAHSNIFWRKGDNIGSTLSFMDLVYQSKDTVFDYYAFADQDDVWLSDKIASAIECLKRKTMPALYSSVKIIVDENLEQLCREDVPYEPGLLNVFFRHNAASGCTMVWNNPFHRILTAIHFDWKEGFHDSWACKLAEVFGVHIFDRTPHILYRQHGDNQVGSQGVGWRELYARLKNFHWGNGGDATKYAKIIYNQKVVKIPPRYERFLWLIAECPHTFSNNIRILRYGTLCKYPFYEYVWACVRILLGRY